MLRNEKAKRAFAVFWSITEAKDINQSLKLARIDNLLGNIHRRYRVTFGSYRRSCQTDQHTNMGKYGVERFSEITEL